MCTTLLHTKLAHAPTGVTEEDTMEAERRRCTDITGVFTNWLEKLEESEREAVKLTS